MVDRSLEVTGGCCACDFLQAAHCEAPRDQHLMLAYTCTCTGTG